MKKPRFKNNNINLIHLLPNVLTSLNIACGVGSILFAIDRHFEAAAILILIAAFFDLIDGKVARLVGASSPFGVQLDSLADLVSFGVAPPVMLHTILYEEMSRLGASLVLIYALCCALRLARYNVQSMGNQKKRRFFVGLPCPAPACLIASLVLASLEYSLPLTHTLSQIILHVMMVCLSGLMVSTVSYPDIGGLKLEKKNVYQYNVFIVLILCVAVLRFKAVLLLLTFAFVASGPFSAVQQYFQKKPALEENPEKAPDSTPAVNTQEMGK
ncbi:MAG: CDP-diacylglycerol--serine O-phosphatidyltransferase [Candidatus Hinthialibacter sp.]